MGTPTAAALVAAFQGLDRDDAIHAIVLWGAGGTFCAGADLRAVAAGWNPAVLLPPSGEASDPLGPMGPTRLELCKPVIAAVAGFAVAGGLELAAWCDLRVAAENLAREIAHHPQGCLRADRASCRGQWGMSQGAALAQEFTRGHAVLASGESADGASRFVAGAGRGGKPVG